MFCQECGAKVTGKFCSTCGAKVIPPEDGGNINPEPAVAESKYESLIKRADVRNLISKYAAQSPHKLSAQDFLKLADLAYKPMAGISMTSLSETVVPMFEKLGIHTGKSFQQIINESTDVVIIKVLCSLAKNGYTLNTVEHANNGIILHASIPSDMLTWGGDLLVVIEEQQAATKLAIDVKIKGQLYDWGKSKGIINKIMSDMSAIKISVSADASQVKHYN